MKQFTLTFLIICISVFSFGQELTKLENEEKIRFNDIRVEVEKNPKESLALIDEYKEEVKTQRGKAFTELLYGLYYYFSGATDRVDSCYIKASEIFNELGDKKGMITAKSNLAVMRQLRGDFELALETYTENLPYLIEIKDTQNIANTHNNMASLFLMTKDYEKAKIHYNKALTYYKSIGDFNGQGIVLSKIGKIEFDAYNFNKANDYFIEALKVYSDSKDSLGVGNTLIKLGDILFEKDKEIKKAMLKYKQANTVLMSIGSICEASFAKQAIGDCYFELKEYQKAKSFYEKAIFRAKLCDYNYALPSMLDNLIKTEEKLGNYKKAYQYQKEQIALKDSIYKIEKIKAINDIDTKYQTAEKDKVLLQNEIDLLTKNKEIEKQNQLFWIVMSVLLMALIVLVMGLYFYKKQKKVNKKLAELNEFKSQIFTIIGHDLRSPIANIATTAESENTKQKTNTALEILDNLLVWGNMNDKAINKNKEQVFLGAIIDELTDEFSKSIQNKQLKIKENFENCTPIIANKNEVTTILRNLLNNAIKYNIENGTINIYCNNKIFKIENTYSNSIKSGTKIGLDIVKKLCKNNNATFQFNKSELAISKITFND
jgi:tetratricopeptide (TPR) repeat protein